MGEGAYYMALKGTQNNSNQKLAMCHFPGTLNVRLDKKFIKEAIKQFETLDGTKIKGFSDGKRTYGWVKCFSAKLNNTADCELIVLENSP